MNFTRLALAAVAGVVADFAYGFAVYGNLLTSSFLAQGAIYRSAKSQIRVHADRGRRPGAGNGGPGHGVLGLLGDWLS